MVRSYFPCSTSATQNVLLFANANVTVIVLWPNQPCSRTGRPGLEYGTKYKTPPISECISTCTFEYVKALSTGMPHCYIDRDVYLENFVQSDEIKSWMHRGKMSIRNIAVQQQERTNSITAL
jgi:hypothetical protein